MEWIADPRAWTAPDTPKAVEIVQSIGSTPRACVHVVMAFRVSVGLLNLPVRAKRRKRAKAVMSRRHMVDENGERTEAF
jgi:hypothetical protein